MIAEALKYLVDLSQKSAKSEKLFEDARGVHYVIDGKIEPLVKEIPPRTHHVSMLAEIIGLANRFAVRSGGDDEGHTLHLGDMDGGDEPLNPVVWYDENHVVLVADDRGYRVETVTLDLVPSDMFARLVALRSNPAAAWMKQRDFVRLLRIDLAGTLAPGVLLNHVRNLKFESGVVVDSSVQRNRESLGKAITSAVSSEKDIPEEVRLEVPVYKTAGEREPFCLVCSVDVDPAQGLLQLLPLPDEIERVQQLAVKGLGERLLEGLNEGIPAYHGRP